jgi:hypothetical protein
LEKKMSLFEINEDDELDDLDEMWEDDEWEDPDFEVSVNKKYPGWYLVKLPGFTAATFVKLEPWLADNVKYGEWQKVGWYSNCSYSVGVVFESPRDAMLFKLRWR